MRGAAGSPRLWGMSFGDAPPSPLSEHQVPRRGGLRRALGAFAALRDLPGCRRRSARRAGGGRCGVVGLAPSRQAAKRSAGRSAIAATQRWALRPAPRATVCMSSTWGSSPSSWRLCGFARPVRVSAPIGSTRARWSVWRCLSRAKMLYCLSSVSVHFVAKTGFGPNFAGSKGCSRRIITHSATSRRRMMATVATILSLLRATRRS